MSTTLDRQNADLRHQLARLENQVNRLRREPSADERNELSDAHVRADSVARQFGTTAPQPLPGETSLAYRRRLLASFAKHSASYKNVRCDAIDAMLLGPAEEKVYADAVAAARDPAAYKPGELRAIQERDPAGRLVTTYRGDWFGWARHFMTDGQIGHINRKPRE